jgi:leader peptidase (prepilin peptidase)/N-methyltransferase
MTGLIVLVSTLLGLAAGSFTNVLIVRLPKGESLLQPSHCIRCGKEIHWHQNVPVLSFLLLRGRCAGCGERFSARYPMVEIATAVCFAFIGVALADNLSTEAFLAAIAFACMVACGIALAVIDIEHRILPNQLVYSTFGVGLVLLSLASVVSSDYVRLQNAAIGLALLTVCFGLVAVLKPSGMGLGDVKLAGTLGFYLAWLGWGALAIGMLVALILAAGFGIALMILRRAKSTSAIAFGPWLIGGSVFGIFAGDQIWQSYLQLVYRWIS